MGGIWGGKLGGDKKKKMISKQIAALAVVMIIAIGTAVLPAMAGTEGTSTGSFNLGNVAPQVTAVALYKSDESDPANEMTPPTEYAVKIDVSDSNTLNDIDEIKVVIKKDGYSGNDDVHNQSTYNWTPSGGWQFVGPTDTLWSLETNKTPGDLNATSGTWWLHFKPSKVATEANWDIEVTAKDNSSATGTNSTQDIPMRLYVEISAVDTSYSFEGVNLNTTANPIKDPDDGNIQVTAIANGAYELNSKTNTTWTGQNTGDVATVDSTGTLDDGEIRLIDNAANNYDGGSKVNTSAYQPIAGYNTLSGPTTESGASLAIYQWLDVASEGLLPDTYQGTYYVQIADA